MDELYLRMDSNHQVLDVNLYRPKSYKKINARRKEREQDFMFLWRLRVFCVEIFAISEAFT